MIVNLGNPKNSKTYTVKVEEEVYMGKMIGDEVPLNAIGVDGKGIITGGSTTEGTPMAPFISAHGYKKLLLRPGFGFKNSAKKGELKRKTVHGKRIDDKIAQINIKIIDLKTDDLDEKFGKKVEETKE